jgi:hypothetical protein
MSNVIWSCMTMVQLLEYIEDGRKPAQAIDEIIVRAKKKEMSFAASVNYCLKIEIDGVPQHTIDPQLIRKPAAAKRQEDTARPTKIKDIGNILNSVKTAPSVLQACEALANCNWDFIDPGYINAFGVRKKMEKTPDEVRGFLHGIINGFHPSWGDEGAPRKLLKMIFDAYFRAYSEQMENAK